MREVQLWDKVHDPRDEKKNDLGKWKWNENWQIVMCVHCEDTMKS